MINFILCGYTFPFIVIIGHYTATFPSFRPRVHTSDGSVNLGGDPNGSHPMAAEIEGLRYEPWMYEASEPQAPRCGRIHEVWRDP